MRKTFGIANKGFHKPIIDVANRKRKTKAKTMIIRALDSLVTKKEDDEMDKCSL